jgi:CHASE2 domain-containing sensor protein
MHVRGIEALNGVEKLVACVLAKHQPILGVATVVASNVIDAAVSLKRGKREALESVTGIKKRHFDSDGEARRHLSYETNATQLRKETLLQGQCLAFPKAAHDDVGATRRQHGSQFRG